ncbi:unnamed protein product [Gongylonema pulchrum]|uniref:Uncharacterized protein n=1 Tax=Gongylonema pulchrum TaxID=637853 RepID=A0A3P6R7M4_9BILA|nr:unnamed protein product [Gongylonema pulchrum]
MIPAVRFGRVPKREKARIAEEMARLADVSAFTSLKKAVEDASSVLETCVSGFLLLVDTLRAFIEQSPLQYWCPVR